MENLIINPGKLNSKKIIGGVWILLGIIALFIGKGSLSEKDWTRPIIFWVIGILFLTPLAGSVKSQVEISEGCLKIIWMNWIRTVTIPETEIEKIILAKDGIKIYRKDKKAVKLLIYYMEKEQKNKVYIFFTEYAREKNFVLER
jgi:hypothetical protein